jgi:hypothetical protein
MARTITETSNRYDQPHRPLPIALLNGAGKIAARFGIAPKLEVESLLAAARRKTGLSDFGEMWFLEPLNVLVESMNREANLTTLGVLIQQGRIVDALANRLRIEALCKKHPEILHIDLGKIIVIAGLQRTGTTTLHRLLAADPAMRSLISWEALNPVPLEGEKPGEPTARINKAKLAEKGLAYLAPEFFAIHPVEFDAPEEDILLLDLSFMTQSPEAIMQVPSYAKWLEQADTTHAYRYLKKTLQVLHFQRPAQNWVLKTPHHMEYLDTLLAVFPQATIVQTHRDPQKTMGSFCSMVAHGRGVFSDQVDAREVARHWTRKVERMMRRSMAVREQHGAQCIDVAYEALVKNPMDELERIYRFAGLPFTEAAQKAVAATQEKNRQHRYGRHVYHLEDFGLSKAAIESQFGFYRNHYRIPHESSRGE